MQGPNQCTCTCIYHIISRPGGINISEKWKEKKHFSRTLPAIWLITIFLLTDFHPDIGKNQSISRIAELRSLKSWREQILQILQAGSRRFSEICHHLGSHYDNFHYHGHLLQPEICQLKTKRRDFKETKSGQCQSCSKPWSTTSSESLSTKNTQPIDFQVWQEKHFP